MRFTRATAVGVTAAIEYTPSIHVEQDDVMSDAFGLYTPDGPTITLSEGMGFEREKITMLHENIHFLFDMTGLDETLGVEEEEVVNRLTPALLSWLRGNRTLVRYLQEELA